MPQLECEGRKRERSEARIDSGWNGYKFSLKRFRVERKGIKRKGINTVDEVDDEKMKRMVLTYKKIKVVKNADETHYVRILFLFFYSFFIHLLCKDHSRDASLNTIPILA